MKRYYRIMLGRNSIFSEECYKGGYVAIGFLSDRNLIEHLGDDWREFNKKFIPVFLEQNPEKKRVAAGLACGMLWTVCKGLQIGDIVLCPNGAGAYYVGEVAGGYEYQQGNALSHHRPVRWYPKTVLREDMSEPLRRSTGSIGSVSEVTKHSVELENLLSDNAPAVITSTDETIEDPSIFALEKHLEDFLVVNWSSTDLGKHYDIFEEDGEVIGQQYPSDTGPIDILAISKDKKELLVVELKKGRVSDVVVGQIQRYMGYVKEELAEEGQSVRGCIIAFEDDNRIQRALSVTQSIDFYTYRVQFTLEKR